MSTLELQATDVMEEDAIITQAIVSLIHNYGFDNDLGRRLFKRYTEENQQYAFMLACLDEVGGRVALSQLFTTLSVEEIAGLKEFNSIVRELGINGFYNILNPEIYDESYNNSIFKSPGNFNKLYLNNKKKTEPSSEDYFTVLYGNLNLVKIGESWYCFDTEKLDQIKSAISSYEEIKDKAVSCLINGTSEFETYNLRDVREHFGVEQEVIVSAEIALELNQSLGNIKNLVSDQFKIRDVCYNRPDLSQTELEERELDFKHFERLIAQKTLRTLSSEYGVEFSRLDPAELFAFSRFSRNADASQAVNVKLFVNEYGITALKAFLAVDYGSRFVDQILQLPYTIGAKETRNLLKYFENILDQSKIFLIDVYSEKSVTGDISRDKSEYYKFISQLNEALLRRAKDLLVAPSKSAFQEQFSLVELKSAFKALNLLFSMLGQTASEDIYEFLPADKSSTQTIAESSVFMVKNKESNVEYKLRLIFRPDSQTDRAGRKLPARINIELDFNTDKADLELKAAFQHKVTKSGGKSKDIFVMRLGIDLEERVDANRQISLDFGRGVFEGKNFSSTGCLIGRMQSLIEVDPNAHHTREPFSSDLADPRIFESIVLSFKGAILKFCNHASHL